MRQTAPDVQVISNITGVESQAMGVDKAAMGHILLTLSKMYSNPWMALVREYAANALDSHQVAGNDGPILVSSPSHFEPKFTVQDFGTGLSKDEVLNVYAWYGTSTKRNSDDQIGHFGIGSKSAFAVGPQFIVTAVKDGMLTTALFKLNDDAAPTVDIMAHRPTDEPNGVRVQVGVSDVGATQAAITKLFATWPQGSVLVDGVEPASVWDSLEVLADDVRLGWRANAYEDDPFIVVMGGVPYSVPAAVVSSLPVRAQQIFGNVRASHAQVYLRVPIGSVDITPSREELMVTENTIATINALVERYHQLIPGWITKKISGAASMVGAIIAYNDLRAKLGNARTGASPTWNGKPVPSNPIESGFDWFRLGRRGYSSPYTARRSTGYRIVPDAGLHHILFVTDVPERRVRTVQLAAKEFLSAQPKAGEDTITYVVACTSALAKDWFDITDPALRTMSFDDFAKYKPAPAARGTGPRSAIQYETNGKGKMTPAELNQEIANGQTVYYLTGYERTSYNYRTGLALDAAEDGTLVLLTSRQESAPFLKRVPGAVHFPGVLTKHAQGVLSTVTQADRDALGASTFLSTLNFEIMSALAKDARKITNPEVKHLIVEYVRANALRGSDRAEVILSALRILNKDAAQLGPSSFDLTRYERVIKELPLLTTYFLRSWMRTPKGNAHLVAYINLAPSL